MNDHDMIDTLLNLSDSQLDAVVKPLIIKWDQPPTPLQILEVLDLCIHDALASNFVVSFLQALYSIACTRVGLTHEQIVEQAIWRQSYE